MSTKINNFAYISYTGSSRSNEKNKSRSRGVYFHKSFIFIVVSGRKIATDYSPTPSRSLRNDLRLPSKVAPTTLAEWKSGSGAGGCFLALNRPREPIFHPNYGEIQFWPKLEFFCGSKTTFELFWGPFWASRAWFPLSQRCRRNLWGKPQNISERSDGVGRVISRYFSARNSCEKKTFMLRDLLFSFFLDDPVLSI